MGGPLAIDTVYPP